MAIQEGVIDRARGHLNQVYELAKVDSPLSTLRTRQPLRSLAAEILTGLASDRRIVISALPEFATTARKTPGNETIRAQTNSLADVLDALKQRADKPPAATPDIQPALGSLKDAIGKPEWADAYSATVNAFAGVIEDDQKLHEAAAEISLTTSELAIDSAKEPNTIKHRTQLSGLNTIATLFDTASLLRILHE